MVMRRDRRSTRRRPRRAGNRWLVPVVGAITPVLLIVVNIAAFIVHHLQAFQLTIAVLAFISGLMLNTWFGISVFRYIKKRAPDHELVHERNLDVIIVAGMGVIILASAATAWFCYQGLSSDKNLPNLSTFVLGVVSILVPIVGREAAERFTAGPSSHEDLGDELLRQ